MTTKNFNPEVNEYQVNRFYRSFCPFGSGDVRSAIEHSICAGYDEDWAVEQIDSFMKDCDIKDYDQIDPVYCVVNSILQEARNEIDNLTRFDVMNDASIDVLGNFMCTSFDCSEDDKNTLIDKLAEYDIIIEDLELPTQYFLDQIEIGQNHIDEAKAKIKAN